MAPGARLWAVTILHGRVWRHGKVVAEDFPLHDLDVLLADPSVLVWLDLVDPDPSTLATLAEELSLDPNAVEDAVLPGERVKLSRHAKHLFLTTYATRIDTDADSAHHSRLVGSQVSIFVLPRGLVTVRRDSSFAMDEVVARWADDQDLCGQGVGGLLHGLLDTIVDGHFDTIQHLDDAIQELEDALFSNDDRPPTGLQQRVYRMRRELVELRRIVLPMREVVATILRRRLVMTGSGGIAVALEGDPATVLDAPPTAMPPTFSPLDGWFDDLYDHVLRASEWTESLRDMLAGIFETNLSLQDARLNTIMKKLAAWAAIIAVPTAVTGWFGQNVPYPGFSTAFGLYQSIAAIVVGSLGLYLLFRKYDWI